MNRKTTGILLAAVVVLALFIFISEHGRRGALPPGVRSAGPRLLQIDQGDILRVRVKRDYWNSFTLSRSPDGSWRIVEPSDEAAAPQAVGQLLTTLESMLVLSTIDLPGDDTARYREYGLWEPSAEITVTVGNRDYTLIFGRESTEAGGIYCAIAGHDGVYVTTGAAYRLLTLDLEHYREMGHPQASVQQPMQYPHAPAQQPMQYPPVQAQEMYPYPAHAPGPAQQQPMQHPPMRAYELQQPSQGQTQ